MPLGGITYSTALNRMMSLCSRSEMSSSDVRLRLQHKGLPSTDINKVIATLEAHGYIDDTRFARAFVHDRLQFAGWGRVKVAYQLRLKGIPSDVIQSAMDEVDDDAYSESLLRILRSKKRSVASKSREQAYASLVRFAAQRGFEADLVYRYAKIVLDEEEPEDD